MLTGLLAANNAQDVVAGEFLERDDRIGIVDRTMENGRIVPWVAHHDDEKDLRSSVPKVQHRHTQLLQDGS